MTNKTLPRKKFEEKLPKSIKIFVKKKKTKDKTKLEKDINIFQNKKMKRKRHYYRQRNRM